MNETEFLEKCKQVGGHPNILTKGLYLQLFPQIGSTETVVVASNYIDNQGAGVIVVTNKMFYALKKNGILSSNVIALPFGRITTCSVQNHFTSHDLLLSEGANNILFKQVDIPEVIAKKINEYRTGSAEEVPVPAAAKDEKPEEAKSNGIDVEEELTKYKGMLEKGLIEQSDYDAKKKQLLGL